jgi:hypothetical protein
VCVCGNYPNYDFSSILFLEKEKRMVLCVITITTFTRLYMHYCNYIVEEGRKLCETHFLTIVREYIYAIALKNRGYKREFIFQKEVWKSNRSSVLIVNHLSCC